MATEYNNIILNISRKPSSKYIVVAIPMYMYRIKTNSFSYGLNFFQKAILKFKAKPGIKEETIAQYLGLDEKLIALLISELRWHGLINEHGALSEKGKEKMSEIDGLIVDSNGEKMGYVFQYSTQDKLYQYYIDKIDTPNLLNENPPRIITGTKGDGRDNYTEPFFLDELYKKRKILPNPDEKQILELIQNSNKKPKDTTDNLNNSTDKLQKQLSIRFIPSANAELVWVCTYIYLQEREDDTFEPDWRVLDPFGFGDNIALKFYLNTKENQDLINHIDTKFANVETVGKKRISEYYNQLNKVIEDKLLSDFSLGLSNLDENLQQYIQAILKHYFLQQYQNYKDMDACVSFSLNIQNALENILKQDKEKRLTVYEDMYNHFEPDIRKIDSKMKYDSLIAVYRSKVLSQNTQVPKRLLSTTNAVLTKSNSLLQYLTSFILTYNFDNKSPLFKVLKDRINTIVEIAQLRNEKGHGQTSNEKRLALLSHDEVEKYYQFIKGLINDYIKFQYYGKEK
jgi:hypothetical protein